jgi:hypothetical protein
VRALLRLHICEIEISFSNLFSREQIPERGRNVCVPSAMVCTKIPIAEPRSRLLKALDYFAYVLLCYNHSFLVQPIPVALVVPPVAVESP